eukprot:SAG31_NODE_60_length_29419_cov_39.876398_22_plen_192_part_00
MAYGFRTFVLGDESAVDTLAGAGEATVDTTIDTTRNVTSDPSVLVEVTESEVTDLASLVGEGMSAFFDWWPNLAAAASLLLCLISILADKIQPEEDHSHLQTVFSWPCLTTAGVMIALLASLRFDGEKVVREGLDDVGCEIQGAVVFYLQLASACWMTAGFHSVYRCDARHIFGLLASFSSVSLAFHSRMG